MVLIWVVWVTNIDRDFFASSNKKNLPDLSRKVFLCNLYFKSVKSTAPFGAGELNKYESVILRILLKSSSFSSKVLYKYLKFLHIFISCIHWHFGMQISSGKYWAVLCPFLTYLHVYGIVGRVFKALTTSV